MKSLNYIAISVATAWLTTACGSQLAAPEWELPTLTVTHSTGKTRLFMEHSPLVAGEHTSFAVQLTRLSDFFAVNAGRPRIEFTSESNGVTSVYHGEPSQPPVFGIEGSAPAAGRYRWALIIDAPGLWDRHELGFITVFADAASAVTDAARRR
jgi:hypothetical protein